MEANKKYEVELENYEVANEKEESSFDIKTLFTILVLNWKWFILSMFICVCGALLYLRSQSPVYSVSAKMLIKDENTNQRRSNQILSNMQDLGFMTNSAGIDNEVEILKSHVLAKEAVKNLKLYVEYSMKGRLREQLIYKNQPINVELDSIGLEKLDKSRGRISMRLTLDGKTYKVENDVNDIKGTFTALPATINSKYGKITFTQNEEYKMGNGQTLIINIMSPTAVSNRYVGSLSVEPTSKMTSIAMLNLRDQNPERGIDYLLELAECYNNQANEDKNEIARKTQEFIAARLYEIESELSLTETEIERYKRDNNLIQLRIDAGQTLGQANEYMAKLTDSQVQLQILDDLRSYVEKPNNKYQLVPSNVGLTDPISSQLIAQYNNTVLERENLLKAVSEEAPQVQKLNARMDNQISAIKDALTQARRVADIQRSGVQKQFDLYQSRVANTPAQERVLTEIGRQQEVKSGLYVMLLQKLEESRISLAATADKGKLIDEPVMGGKVSPKNSIVMFAAIVLGFAVPLLIFYLLQLLRYKIEGREDVQKLTKLPILADVAVASESVKTSAGIVVHENQNNLTDEIFRSMRTNIEFMLKGNQKVILFTSTTSGEGKTFNAANLAVSFALLGKKVILMGLDIRKPALGRLFSIKDRQTGITSLLTKEDVSEQDLKQIIMPSGVNDNLDLILAGPVPPNPTELLSRQNMITIMDMLREKYDYIILDSAPVGLVTDTLQIAKYADATAYVCRADYTPKSSFGLLNELAREKKLPNLGIVLNGVDMSKRKYGYYYGYGKYGRYGQYIYGARAGYGHYGNYSKYSESHYSTKADDSIKK